MQKDAITFPRPDDPASGRMLRAIFDRAGVGIALMSPAGSWLQVNPKFCDIFGFAEVEILGRELPAIVSTNEDTFVKIRQLLNGESGQVWVEAPFTNRYGVSGWMSFNEFPVRGSDGKTVYFIVIVEEITMRRQAEADLKRARELAEAANKAKSSFLANMSHELRTPLNAILGFSQILSMEEEGTLNDRQREYLAYITESGSHLLEMVNDILDLSKIESGKLELEMRPFPLGLMLGRSPSTIQSLARQKQVVMVTDISPDLGVLSGDEVRLKQVLYNLLSNAIKFTPAGKEIGISAHPDGERALIEVWDRGIGIPGEDLEKIFDPFEQVRRNLASQGTGTGLGLTITRRIIELHGGTITVRSRLGEGTTFSIMLPGRKDAEALPVSGREEPEAAGDDSDEAVHGSLLVIEDNRINSTLLRSMLRDGGYAIDFVEDGEQALACMGKQRYDLILMDIELPDIQGTDLLRLARNTVSGDAVIIASTAYAMKGDRERFLAMGFDNYISKPYDLRRLRRIVGEYLRRR